MSAPAAPPARIASLLASGTELVCALGLGDRLVARSHECDFPAWVERLPAVSRPTFPVDGTSADIDARVRERLRVGAPLYEIDDALLASLAPDVIVTQTHCDVCAVTPGDSAVRKSRYVREVPRVDLVGLGHAIPERFFLRLFGDGSPEIGIEDINDLHVRRADDRRQTLDFRHGQAQIVAIVKQHVRDHDATLVHGGLADIGVALAVRGDEGRNGFDRHCQGFLVETNL